MTDRDAFPGFPTIKQEAWSERYGHMKLLSLERTSDGHLIGFARVHIGEPNEHEHSIFIGGGA